jgi:hypothetical protein
LPPTWQQLFDWVLFQESFQCSARWPEIQRDIDDMLNCGTLEHDAWRQGYLSYQLLTFDRP